MYNTGAYKDDIVYYKDAISEPARLIEIINEINENPKSYESISKWSDWYASNDSSMLYGETKMFTPIHNTEDIMLNRKMLYVYNSLYSAMWFCTRLYAESRNLAYPEDKLSKTFALNKYYTGRSMGPHVDSYNPEESNLNFSIVVYLNDDYEGGEINFPNQNFTIKPEAGSLIVFPSSEPYIHESKEITSGVKYMAPGFWLK